MIMSTLSNFQQTKQPLPLFLHKFLSRVIPMTHWLNSMSWQRLKGIMMCAQDPSLPPGSLPTHFSPQVSEYDDDVGDKDISEDGETDDEYHGEAGPPIKRVRLFSAWQARPSCVTMLNIRLCIFRDLLVIPKSTGQKAQRIKTLLKRFAR